MFKVDLRWILPEGRTRLTDQIQTDDAGLALMVYRSLLRRDDLVGKSVAARFVVGGKSLYYSDFTKAFGAGRVHPQAPLEVEASPARASALMAWKPQSGSPADVQDLLVAAQPLLGFLAANGQGMDSDPVHVQGGSGADALSLGQLRRLGEVLLSIGLE